jgi:hemolysin activation/secretion protein
VTHLYREQGYPFARAYLPVQKIESGVVQINVIEGRYGEVTSIGEGKLKAQAQPFLSDLKPGEIIEATSLERTVLVLGDQPGVALAPVIKPGAEVGTGDLEARVAYGERVAGKLSFDNLGNRYTGSIRALAAFSVNSPLMLGDQFKAGGMVTNESLWFGQLAYSLPLGSSGLRGEIGYAHTDYELGKEFESLEASGTAKIASVSVSYPLIRSRQRNLVLSAQYQHKKLKDEYGGTNVVNEKSSEVSPLTMQFDLLDQWGGGAVSYGALTWTLGELSLESASLRSQDRATAKTEGGFQKLNLDIARLQRLTGRLTLFGRLSAQLADENLDSSEKFNLGGANGVRAYPQGEGMGDRGVFGQLELRYSLEHFTPYALYDAGAVRINSDPWAAGNNHRSVAGAGLGVRVNYQQLSIDASAAWPVHGGNAESDSRQHTPRIWVKAEYAF